MNLISILMGILKDFTNQDEGKLLKACLFLYTLL